LNLRKLFILISILLISNQFLYADETLKKNEVKSYEKEFSLGVYFGGKAGFENGYLENRIDYPSYVEGGIFLSYKKFYFDFWFYACSVGVTDQFIEESGYEKQHFNLQQENTGLTLGYDLFNYSGLLLSPYLGVKYAEIEEDNGKYDPHPNWDLSTKSNFYPMYGLRIKYNVSSQGRFNHFVYFDFRVSRYSFDNVEYGQGNTIEFSVGYMPEFIFKRKEAGK